MENKLLTKTCNTCAETKSIESYGRYKGRDGNYLYKNRCKCCTKAYNSLWCKNNPEKVKAVKSKGYYNRTIEQQQRQVERHKLWRKNNPEKMKEAHSIWVKNNPEKMKEAHSIWVKNNPEKMKKIRKRHYSRNIEKERERAKLWVKNNPEKMKARNKNMADVLTDAYVTKEIKRGTFLTSETIRRYPELIEAKRLIIKTKRICKTSKI